MSILLAITPLLVGLEHGREIFNIAFIIVLVSLVIQGWTVGSLARRLGLIVPARIGPLRKGRARTAGLGASRAARLHRRRRQPGGARRADSALGAAVAGRARGPLDAVPGHGPPDGRRPCLYLRAGPLSRLLDRLFASRTEVDPEDADFFGAFAVDPGRPAGELEAAYAPGLSDAEKKLTIGALVEKRLGGRAEYADRVTLGPIELIVRDVDDNGKVTGLGLSFEPVATSPRIPVFLSAGEIGDRLRRLVAGLRKRHCRAAGRSQPCDTRKSRPSDALSPALAIAALLR